MCFVCLFSLHALKFTLCDVQLHSVLTNAETQAFSTPIEENSFSTFKVPPVCPIHSQPLPPPPPPPATSGYTNKFSIPVALPFPECHMIGIIQYVAFWFWLFHLGFVYVVACVSSFCFFFLSFFFCRVVFYCVDLPPFFYSLPC